MPTLAQTLQSLHVAPAVTQGNLTMFPLLRPALAEGPVYLLLDEALGAGQADVTEVSEQGSVPELQFSNRADRDILLIDGEELIGAKQNRVLNLTILVGAGQQVKIPVSCVEAGRWIWRSKRFESGGRKLHAKARMDKMRGVSASMRESGQRARHDIQAAVWRSVEDKMAAFECQSATASLHDVYKVAENDLAQVRAKFKQQPAQVGAVFAVDGRLVGAELFDSADTLGKLLPKLVDSYAFDAFESRGDRDAPDTAEPPSLEEVKALLARIARAPQATYAAVAKGIDVRIDEPSLRAAALVEGERVVHLSAFAVE